MLSDVGGLPEECGVLADSFDNVGLVGKQELGRIFAGSDRFKVGSFAVVVKHRRKQRRNSFQHFLSSRPVIGSEERIEKSFEFLLVEDLESIHVIGVEVTVHGARKKDRKLPEEFWTVREFRRRKAIEVVKIARVVPVNHRLCLAAEQFLDFENQIPARCSMPDGHSVEFAWRQRAGAHQEIDFDLDALGSAGVIFEIEVPLPQGVVVCAILDLVAEAGGDLFDRLYDLWTVLEGCLNDQHVRCNSDRDRQKAVRD
jgi:hypothetical protein